MKTDKDKGHNLNLKMHISGDIKEMKQNDVIKYDEVNKKWKMVKIRNFLVFSREKVPENKNVTMKYLNVRKFPDFREWPLNSQS